MAAIFSDRAEAGKLLAKELSAYRKKNNVVVLALPRGGVPVGAEIAKALKAPFDLMLVRKLGLPGQSEVAMGAVVLPDICSFNENIVQNNFLSQEDIGRVVEKEIKELQRRNRLYRESAPTTDVKGKIVVLADDGVATGADMRAAIRAVHFGQPEKIVAAVPVAPHDALIALRQIADEVVCLSTPSPFFAVGQAYGDFEQTTDEEIIDLMKGLRKK